MFRPLPVGSHTVDIYGTLSADHWDGFDVDPAVDLTPAGETHWAHYASKSSSALTADPAATRSSTELFVAAPGTPAAGAEPLDTALRADHTSSGSRTATRTVTRRPTSWENRLAPWAMWRRLELSPAYRQVMKPSSNSTTGVPSTTVIRNRWWNIL